MKNIYALLASMLLCISVFAQPIIPRDSGIYEAGSVFVLKEVALTADQEVGSDGAMVLWDFSGLTPTSTRTTNVDSAETSSILHDINANMKVTINRGPSGTQTQVYYYYVTTSNVEYCGKIDNGIPLDVADDPVQMWDWPMEYQESASDTIHSKFEYGQTPFSKKWHYLNGNMTTTVDGYGRVKLPYGDVYEVLRLKIVETYSDSTTTEVTPVTNTTYEWRTAKNNIYIARYEKREEGTTTDRFFYYLDEADLNPGEQPAGIPQMVGLRNEVLLYPNPANSDVSVSFNMLNDGPLGISVYDFQGRLLKTLMKESVDAGLQLYTFDLSELPAGNYLLRLEKDGIVQEKKLLKN